MEVYDPCLFKFRVVTCSYVQHPERMLFEQPEHRRLVQLSDVFGGNLDMSLVVFCCQDTGQEVLENVKVIRKISKCNAW